jgi:hypothetical protein
MGRKIDCALSSNTGRGRRRTKVSRASKEESLPSSYAYAQLVIICFKCAASLFAPRGYVVMNVITTLVADSRTVMSRRGGWERGGDNKKLDREDDVVRRGIKAG